MDAEEEFGAHNSGVELPLIGAAKQENTQDDAVMEMKALDTVIVHNPVFESLSTRSVPKTTFVEENPMRGVPGAKLSPNTQKLGTRAEAHHRKVGDVLIRFRKNCCSCCAVDKAPAKKKTEAGIEVRNYPAAKADSFSPLLDSNFKTLQPPKTHTGQKTECTHRASDGIRW